MKIEEIQKINIRNEKYTRLLIGLLRFFIRPACLMLLFWLVISLPFGVQPLTYLQAIILQIFINLINEL
jgi:hypothetical protein